MRNKSFIFFLVILLISLCGKAQDKKIKFHSINSVGFVVGESNSDMMLETVNGIAYKNFYSGIGFGADFYNYNSYPLFFDQRLYFGKQNKIFVSGDLGYNFNAKNKPGKEIFYYSNYHFTGGVFTGLGVGYKIKFAKNNSFLLGIGYSYKELYNKIGVVNPAIDCATGVACPVEGYNGYKYGNGRLVLKAGIDF